MSSTAVPGPLSVTGIPPTITGPAPYIGGSATYTESNADAGPSLLWMGSGVRDPRYLARIGAGANVAGGYPNQDCGWYAQGPGIIALDQVPSTASNVNIAVGQAVASGTPMTLVAASGAGITLLASAFTVLPTGLVVPSGALALDGNPAWLGAGPTGAFAFFDPTAGLARAVAVTAAAGATGGVVNLVGYDLYGNRQTQAVTAVAGATVNSTKTFKWLVSATPAFTDAGHNYSIGTADVFGFPVRVDRFAYADIFWNNAAITSNAGLVAADTTSPATNVTGDVRGSYSVQSASDGVKRLQVFIAQSVANAIGATWAACVQGLIGVQPV